MGGSRALVVIDVREASDLLENSCRGNISEQLVIVRFLCQENTREGLWTHLEDVFEHLLRGEIQNVAALRG